MFSNSKDQVSLEEAYGAVRKTTVNENLLHSAAELIRSTAHLPAGIQGLITLASFIIPGFLGAGTVAAIQDIISKNSAIKGTVKNITDIANRVLSGKSPQEKEEKLNHIDKDKLKALAKQLAAHPTEIELDRFLSELQSSLSKINIQHGYHQAKKVAAAIDAPVQLERESANSTLRYLGGKASGRYNPDHGVIEEGKTTRKGSTLDYLK
jgi:hypothetical protein